MEDKEQKIINSAINYFSKYGYKKTSISDIYKSAEVSKGLVYYYFKDKKDLYLKSFEHSIRLVNDLIENTILSDIDIISKLSDITVIKMEFFLSHKSVLDFIVNAYKETSTELEPEFSEIKNNNHTNSLDVLFKNINNDYFLDKENIKESIAIISFTMNGAYTEAMSKSTSIERKIVIEGYRDRLIKLFYKEEVSYGCNKN